MKRFDPPLRHFLASERTHLRKLKTRYCIHLWNQLWGEAYLATLSPADIVAQRHNLARVVVWALRDTHVLDDIASYARAPVDR